MMSSHKKNCIKFSINISYVFSLFRIRLQKKTIEMNFWFAAYISAWVPVAFDLNENDQTEFIVIIEIGDKTEFIDRLSRSIK